MAGEFLEILKKDQLAKVARCIEKTVNDSFTADGTRATAFAKKQRAQHCIDLIRHLMRDHHYAAERAMDVLPSALRCKLEGVDWTPDARSVYVPHEGQVVLPGEGVVWAPGDGKIPGV